MTKQGIAMASESHVYLDLNANVDTLCAGCVFKLINSFERGQSRKPRAFEATRSEVTQGVDNSRDFGLREVGKTKIELFRF